MTFQICLPLRLLKLLPQNTLERHSIGGELGDTLTELLDCHLLLVEVEAVRCLVIDISLLLNVETLGCGSVELLWDFGL